MRDPGIAKLMKALARRFPGTTMITGPMEDLPYSGEVVITLLNAPTEPPTLVRDVSNRMIRRLWGDEPDPVFVRAISPEDSAKYYAKHLPESLSPRVSSRRGASVRAARSKKAPARRRRPSAV